MPKGRHAVRKKQQENSAKDFAASSEALTTSSKPSFVALGWHAGNGADRADRTSDGAEGVALACPQLLVIAFDSKTAQHDALARIEAFYESADQNKAYLSADAAKQMRLCPNYEAFNVPMDAIRQWLDLMRKTEGQGSGRATVAAQDTEAAPEMHWTDHCNAEECRLLELLNSLGCLDEHETKEQPKSDKSVPTYLVSVLSSQITHSLPHEQLHFLYNVAAEYRAAVQKEYENLLPKTRKIIESDLAMRKYAAHVFADEFQAYISLDAGEFGAKTREECTPIRTSLLRLQRSLWAELANQSAR